MTVSLIHQEPTSDARTGKAFYFTYTTPLRSDSFKVVELNTGLNFTHEHRYFVQTFRRDGWTTVIGNVTASDPEAALNVAFAVLNFD